MIEINNLTEIEINQDFIKKIVKEVLKKEKKEGNISIAFIGPGRMRKLNKKYRGRNRVTDVLSFPEIEVSFEKFFKTELKKTKSLGEIVICLRAVKKSSQELNIPFERELIRVLVHGILHLLGYDHERPEKEAEIMKEKEEKYLKLLNC